ncbi:recombinase family protein [Rhizobium sp. GN54]|uniref:recombinase family protein n=1 Tax=Rhizobium sp. GN54 TaxID=2898150 RepID=UPI001E5AC4C3|nr:recombinase family protein [Rhizobium sp. GN54]MCD2185522.1 recombinase family protein [Rhizobium sp. GN54]
MTKNVLFYARYSTDRQNEVSIETQVELGKAFVANKGWKLVETYADSAISGTSFTSRPGIQQVLAHVKRERIDVVLCVTADRLSRDVEHSSKILKELNYHDTAIWTVQAGQEISHMELHMRSTLSHELVEQIRYRTREGMKTAVKKGKASTCLAYGYKLSQQRDANGDRIRGLRDVDPVKAEIVRRIYQLYADGMSPRDIAHLLNNEGVPGPRGRKWRDTAIRGHVGRGTGILNNESYIGRIVWNRRQYRKNPQTEKRTARANDTSEWILTEVPQMRIISDELWSRVKDRQKEIGELFDFGQSNRLNATHRPEYLLSHLLECDECGGPYAISGKDRYSCTNRKKRLPIDELGGACCSNSKTIIRQELESRVLDCLPAAFFAEGIFDTLSERSIAYETAKLKRPLAERDQLKRKLSELEGKQQNIIQQISDRAAEGRPRLLALDDTLDRLEAERQTLENEVANFTESGPDMIAKIEELRRRHNPEETEMAMRQFMMVARKGKNEEAKRMLMPIVRQLVQKVVVGKTPGHQPASLQVHGLIASILAQMDVLDYMKSRFISEIHEDFVERLEAGEIDSEEKKEMLLDIYREELLERFPQWENLQMSVVAGAGFEPAAFRL